MARGGSARPVQEIAVAGIDDPDFLLLVHALKCKRDVKHCTWLPHSPAHRQPRC